MFNVKKLIFVVSPLLLFIYFFNFFIQKDSILVENNVKNLSIGSSTRNLIVLLSLESVRWDHLSFIKYERSTTPFFEKLLNESLVFENVFTAIPITAPSHASMFSALRRSLGEELINTGDLGKEITLLAEYLREEGYKTGAFTGSDVLRNPGFEQGFDVYEKVQFTESNGSGSVYMQKNRRSIDTIALALGWLDTLSSNDKIFIWIHLADPHYKLLSDGPFYINSKSDSIKSDIDLKDYLESKEKVYVADKPIISYHEDRISFDQLSVSLKNLNKYDGAIQEIDKQSEKLYKYFENKGMLEDSLWFILADHGEGLGSHNYRGHSNRIYQEQIRTPLIMHSPSMTEGYRLPYLAENVDILPTIAEIVGFELTDEYEIDGESLLKYIREGKGKDYVFSMTPTNKAYSIQNEKYKYIYHDKEIIEWGEVVNKDMFFDLENDPYEQNNIIGTMPKIENEMKELILERAIESEI